MMDNLIHKPRYIALDSSHLTQLVKDFVSVNERDRRYAKDFLIWLEKNGYILLITIHHIEELMNHQNELVVLSRLRFLGSMKLLAWVGHGALKVGPESVVSLMEAEIRAAYTVPEADILEVIKRAASDLIQIGTGEDLLGPNPDEWLLLRPYFASHAIKAREIVACAHTNVIDNEEVLLKEFLNGSLRKGDDLRRSLNIIQGSLGRDIEIHGDKRINDPHGMAASFMSEVEEMAGNHTGTAAELVLKGLAMLDVWPEDLKDDSTLGYALDLGEFRLKAKVAAKGLGLPWLQIKRRVKMDKIPTWIISKNLQRYAPDLPERKGSELNDIHLSCLSPYADITFVDKRTLESFRRARKMVPLLNKICKKVERSALYKNIPDILSRNE